MFEVFFFFSESITIGMAYLDMLEELLMAILKKRGFPRHAVRQHAASPHFHKEVTDFLKRKFTEK
jgi:hypothetical protein